jgi:hypothetical protein
LTVSSAPRCRPEATRVSAPRTRAPTTPLRLFVLSFPTTTWNIPGKSEHVLPATLSAKLLPPRINAHFDGQVDDGHQLTAEELGEELRRRGLPDHIFLDHGPLDSDKSWRTLSLSLVLPPATASALCLRASPISDNVSPCSGWSLRDASTMHTDGVRDRLDRPRDHRCAEINSRRLHERADRSRVLLGVALAELFIDMIDGRDDSAIARQ